jgi:GntR family L-lactate dehydrogenase operon transcriptional regulator
VARRNVVAPPSSDELIATVLELIDNIGLGRPVGSRVINQSLMERQLALSESTVARLLSQMDRAGHTVPNGNQGRILTPQGRRHYQGLRDRSRREGNARRMWQILGSVALTDMRNVLVARRGIEREIAREAALHASGVDVAALRAAVRRNQRRPTEDVHRVLVKIAHNPFLEAVYQVLTQDPRMQRLVNQLPVRPTSRSTRFGERLLEAIVRHDANLAEALMVDHIDELIAATNELQRSEKGSAKQARRR